MAIKLLKNIRNRIPVGLLRVLINLWPPFFGAGIKIKTISKDYRFVEVIMKLHWYNRNFIGTHFGGSIFAMTDAFYVIMLIKNLGDDYIVWDKAALIEFLKPGKGKLHVIFKFSDEEIDAIRNLADANQKHVFERLVEVKNEEEITIAKVMKTLYVRRKSSRHSG